MGCVLDGFQQTLDKFKVPVAEQGELKANSPEYLWRHRCGRGITDFAYASGRFAKCVSPPKKLAATNSRHPFRFRKLGVIRRSAATLWLDSPAAAADGGLMLSLGDHSFLAPTETNDFDKKLDFE